MDEKKIEQMFLDGETETAKEAGVFLLRLTLEVLDIVTQIMKEKGDDDIKFYNVEEVMKLTGWGRHTVEALFNDPKFNSSNMGKKGIILHDALKDYFSVKHVKETDLYWRSI